MRKTLRNLFFLSMLVSLSGCYIFNPNIMLRTKRNFSYTEFQDSLYTSKEYKIAPNDNVNFRIFTNDGFKLIDITSIQNSSSAALFSTGNTYIVEHDGYAKLPVLGKVKLSGLTIREAETMLEQEFTEFYVKPFVLLNVQNRRVIIFPGNAGAAQVIPLQNNNTKLIEAIAQAGGLSANGKAHRIKLIRGDLQNPEIYLIDLSTIEGIKQANITLQGNDIIYVEPRLNLSREILNEVTPILSILTSMILAISLFR